MIKWVGIMTSFISQRIKRPRFENQNHRWCWAPNPPAQLLISSSDTKRRVKCSVHRSQELGQGHSRGRIGNGMEASGELDQHLCWLINCSGFSVPFSAWVFNISADCRECRLLTPEQSARLSWPYKTKWKQRVPHCAFCLYWLRLRQFTSGKTLWIYSHIQKAYTNAHTQTQDSWGQRNWVQAGLATANAVAPLAAVWMWSFPSYAAKKEQVQQERGRCQESESGSGDPCDPRQRTPESHACLALICKTRTISPC